jgi:hypothetical protein
MSCLLNLCLPVMHCIGFTARGVGRGTLAALVHSSIGIVRAGSCFARCQSVAMSSSPCGCFFVTLCWVVFFTWLGLWFAGISIPTAWATGCNWALGWIVDHPCGATDVAKYILISILYMDFLWISLQFLICLLFRNISNGTTENLFPTAQINTSTLDY